MSTIQEYETQYPRLLGKVYVPSDDRSASINGSFLLTGMPKPKKIWIINGITNVVEMSISMATAGHVNNGKTETSSVLASISRDNIDRSEEERATGNTIHSTTIEYHHKMLVHKDQLPSLYHEAITQQAPQNIAVLDRMIYSLNHPMVSLLEHQAFTGDVSQLVIVICKIVHTDAPGHKQYEKNTASALEKVPIVYLICNASAFDNLPETQPQLVNHLRICVLSGCPSVQLNCNKMDLLMEQSMVQKYIIEGRDEPLPDEWSCADSETEFTLTMGFSDLYDNLDQMLKTTTNKMTNIQSAGYYSAYLSNLSLGPNSKRSQIECVHFSKHHTLSLFVPQAFDSYTSDIIEQNNSINRQNIAPYAMVQSTMQTKAGYVVIGFQQNGIFTVNDSVAIYHAKLPKPYFGTIGSLECFNQSKTSVLPSANFGMTLKLEDGKAVKDIPTHSIILSRSAPYYLLNSHYIWIVYTPNSHLVGGRKEGQYIAAGYSCTVWIGAQPHSIKLDTIICVDRVLGESRSDAQEKANRDAGIDKSHSEQDVIMPVVGNNKGYSYLVLAHIVNDKPIIIPKIRDDNDPKIFMSEIQHCIKSKSRKVSSKGGDATNKSNSGITPKFDNMTAELNYIFEVLKPPVLALMEYLRSTRRFPDNILKYPTCSFKESGSYVGSGTVIQQVEGN